MEVLRVDPRQLQERILRRRAAAVRRRREQAAALAEEPARRLVSTAERVAECPRPAHRGDELQRPLDLGPLERLLDGERRLIERGVSLPAGGSLLVVARKA